MTISYYFFYVQYNIFPYDCEETVMCFDVFQIMPIVIYTPLCDELSVTVLQLQ